MTGVDQLQTQKQQTTMDDATSADASTIEERNLNSAENMRTAPQQAQGRDPLTINSLIPGAD